MNGYFEEYIKHMMWDGRVVGFPFLFAIVGFDEETGMKSREVAEIVDGVYKFINT